MKNLALISHGHPDIAIGGAEVASYNLFRQLNARSADFSATFIARCPPGNFFHDAPFRMHRGRHNEWLWNLDGYDWFRSLSTKPDVLKKGLDQLFAIVNPHIVHIGHYVHFGLELIDFCHEAGVPVVLTLHEYYGMCARNGQMLRSNGRKCTEAIHANCSNCLISHSSGKFFLRERRIKHSFDKVTSFIAPSRFLASMYQSWGVGTGNMDVVENLLHFDSAKTRISRAAIAESRIRFGFFGQLSVAKGINLLLEAMRIIAAGDFSSKIELHIFGANLHFQHDADKDVIETYLKEADDTVKFHGAYDNSQTLSLMRSVDWLVLPSIWWENSPVVLEEARAAGIPALVSNIGGMAEKVRPGVDGTHFIAGSSQDLADTMMSIAAGDLTCAVQPADFETASSKRLEQHVAVYRRSLGTGGMSSCAPENTQVNA